MSSSKLKGSTLSVSVDNIQQSPPMRIANQNEASLPSAKQNTREDRDPSEKMNKKRKKRTLKDLVRICEELGDRSDKSKLLTRWKNYRKDPDWKALTNGHIKNTIHELVIKLENFYKDLQTGGEASGKGRDVIRERYWESSPLTTPNNTLKEDILVPQWTRLQVESWALYMESQIVFASLGMRICKVVGKSTDLRAAVEAEKDFLVDAPYQPGGDDFDYNDDFDVSPDSFGHSDYLRDSCLVSYDLTADETIPVFRFILRTRLELERRSKEQHCAARAFQIAFMFRVEVLGFAETNPMWWRGEVDETNALLLVLLSQEQEDRYPEYPLDCAHAFTYLTSYIVGENKANVVRQLGSVIDSILPLVVRDLRREYRRQIIPALGQRLPADIHEVILDWVEAAHDLPKNRKEYAKRLSVEL